MLHNPSVQKYYSSFSQLFKQKQCSYSVLYYLHKNNMNHLLLFGLNKHVKSERTCVLLVFWWLEVQILVFPPCCQLISPASNSNHTRCLLLCLVSLPTDSTFVFFLRLWIVLLGVMQVKLHVSSSFMPHVSFNAMSAVLFNSFLILSFKFPALVCTLDST